MPCQLGGALHVKMVAIIRQPQHFRRTPSAQLIAGVSPSHHLHSHLDIETTIEMMLTSVSIDVS